MLKFFCFPVKNADDLLFHKCFAPWGIAKSECSLGLSFLARDALSLLKDSSSPDRLQQRGWYKPRASISRRMF